MSKQLFYDGYSQYELQSLKIPNQARGECLKYYVPYFKCILNANSFYRWVGRVCQDQKHDYQHCRGIQRDRVMSTHLMKMKLNNPQKFEQLKVAPALDAQYSPSFLNYTRH